MFKQGKVQTAPTRVLRSQSQKVHPRPAEREGFENQYEDEQRLRYAERDPVESMKQESTSKKMERRDEKWDEKVNKEYTIREGFEDEVDMASYDSFPASDPPSTEMSN